MNRAMGVIGRKAFILGGLLSGLVFLMGFQVGWSGQPLVTGKTETSKSDKGWLAWVSAILPANPGTALTSPHPERVSSNYLVDFDSGGRLLRWDAQRRSPIRVYIANGEGLEGYQPGADAIIWRAIQTWQHSMKDLESNAAIGFVRVQYATEADIEIYWTDRVLPSEISEYSNATCERAILNRRDIFHAVITLCTKEPYTLAPFSSDRIQQLALHEVGHVLGLGHSLNATDVMSSGLGPSPILQPTERDVNTLRLLYQNSGDPDVSAQPPDGALDRN